MSLDFENKEGAESGRSKQVQPLGGLQGGLALFWKSSISQVSWHHLMSPLRVPSPDPGIPELSGEPHPREPAAALLPISVTCCGE